MTPPTNIKKYGKWKKEQFRLIEYELKDKEELIEKLSPFYSVKDGGINNDNKLSIFDKGSKVYLQLKSSNDSSINASLQRMHKNVWSILRSLIVLDKGIAEYDIKDTKTEQARDEGIKDIVGVIYHLSAESKYYFLKTLCDLGELSPLTETRICWDCYYENNDMKSDFTYKIGKMLINRVDEDTIDEVIEWEIEQEKENNELSIRNEMSIKDALKMQEYREKGEMFYAYRGFLVEEDEYVRAGKKEDGDAYYQWNAGQGLSFSFNEKTAYYFCFWQMCFQEFKGKFKSKDNPLEQIPNSIKTKEEWITETAERISQMRDTLRKKPIVARFLIEPTTMAMTTSAKNEAEVNVAPDKVLLVDYKIPTSRQIAEGMWETKYARWTKTSDLFVGIDKSKVVMFNTIDNNGNRKAVFAEAEEVKDEINKCKTDFIASGDYATFHLKVTNIFNNNAVEIPKDINPMQRVTRRFIDFITRNEERLVRKRAQQYVTSKSY